MHSAETSLIPAAGNYPSPFTMDKAPSHMAPRGIRAGCRPSPASDSLRASLGQAAPEQAFPLIAALGSRHRAGSLSPITAGQTGGTGAGGAHGKIEMLWTKAEDGIATGGGRPSRAGEKHGDGVVQQGHTRSVCLTLIFPNCAA